MNTDLSSKVDFAAVSCTLNPSLPFSSSLLIQYSLAENCKLFNIKYFPEIMFFWKNYSNTFQERRTKEHLSAFILDSLTESTASKVPSS